ncbi:MAG TPA: ATP-binding protein [Ramlibacter sp.]|nr:ATP-binding protein [Ramlibacter sp.]
MEMTQSGPAPAAMLDTSDHSVRFYDEDDELLQEVTDFLDNALRAGGLAVAIATTSHHTELRRRLSGFGDNGRKASSRYGGKLVLLDADHMLQQFMVGKRPDPGRFDSAIGPLLRQGPAGKPLHAFGEMVALLCQRDNYEGALQLEGLWNELLGRHSFSLFCAYPWKLFASNDQAGAFRHVCQAHRRVSEGKVREVPMSVTELRREVRALKAELEQRKVSEHTLRRREKELVEFLDNAVEGIHKVAADGTILYANRAELDLLGYEWDEYVGRNIADFYVDQAHICDILRRLKGGAELHDEPALLRCKDGSHKYVLVCSNACFEGGEFRYTRCFTRDASERLARDKALASAREANRVKDEFLAMLGHELRNPLSPIVTALRLMQMRGDSATVKEQTIIQRQVQHLVRLVDDLLDVSRIARGNIELKRQPTDLGVVLANAVEQASVLIEQRNHRLELDVAADLQCECDPVRIGQVVANLLTNAARYTPSGGDIALRARCDDHGNVVVSVRDNGCGIAPDILPKIFELFFQGPRGVDRAEGGLGIGLALVKSLVQLHGGSVEAHSAGLGRGSEFTVRFPVAPGASDGQPAQAALRVATAGGKRILVVDDNVDGAETMSEFLEAAGHTVSVFHDPASALAALARVQPEFALLDIGLPVMDGYELAAKVREACGDGCKLIALTGYGQDSDKARASAAGFDMHLVKPVGLAEVLEIFRDDK